MNKQIADQWIATLRSGKYKQNKGSLRDNDKYCCLGVLCNISRLTDWNNDTYFNIVGHLPKEVLDWSGIISPMGRVNNETTYLSSMNDDGFNFNEIADFIEQNWEKL